MVFWPFWPCPPQKWLLHHCQILPLRYYSIFKWSDAGKPSNTLMKTASILAKIQKVVSHTYKPGVLTTTLQHWNLCFTLRLCPNELAHFADLGITCLDQICFRRMNHHCITRSSWRMTVMSDVTSSDKKNTHNPWPRMSRPRWQYPHYNDHGDHDGKMSEIFTLLLHTTIASHETEFRNS
jgi:hypothetical protein